jgi:hypothetical protein
MARKEKDMKQMAQPVSAKTGKFEATKNATKMKVSSWTKSLSKFKSNKMNTLNAKSESFNYGKVLSIKDGVVSASGLETVCFGELVCFNNQKDVLVWF